MAWVSAPEAVVQYLGVCDGLSPLRRASLVTAGCEPRKTQAQPHADVGCDDSRPMYLVGAENAVTRRDLRYLDLDLTLEGARLSDSSS